MVGRSNIVGKPMAQLLLAENCTLTLAHSHTRDLPAVSAAPTCSWRPWAGPNHRGDWVKPGAIVIDVGIQRVATGGKTRLVGDVAFQEAAAGGGRHHAGSGWRRPDDHRLPAAATRWRRRKATGPNSETATLRRVPA